MSSSRDWGIELFAKVLSVYKNFRQVLLVRYGRIDHWKSRRSAGACIEITCQAGERLWPIDKDDGQASRYMSLTPGSRM